MAGEGTAPRWVPRLATRADLPAIHDLYRTVWGVGRSAEHLAWKLFDAPFDPIPPVLAMDGERCAGVYAVISTPLILDGAKVMGAQSVDTMTHPDYRRQNMSVTLARFCYAEAERRGFTLVYGVPNENSYPMFMKKLDWRHIDDVVRHVRPLCAPKRVPRLLAGPLDMALGLHAGAAALLGPRARVVPVRPETHVVLPDIPPPRARCVVDKSAQWFAWRYGAEPGGHYEMLTLGAPDRPDALVLFDQVAGEGDAPSLLRISEWMATSSRAQTAALKAVVALASRRGCSSVFLFTNDPQAGALLKRNLFFRRETMPLCLGGLGAFKAREPDRAGALVVLGGDKD